MLISGDLRAKVTDFGSIRQRFHMGTTLETSLSDKSKLQYSQKAISATMTFSADGSVGTPAYMSPESLEGLHCDNKADVFSFGVLMWEIATERVPDLVEQEVGADFRGPYLAKLLSLLQDGKKLTYKEGKTQ